MWWCTLQHFGSTAPRSAWRTAEHHPAPPPPSNAGQPLQSALSGQTSVSSPLLHFLRAPPRYLQKVLNRICPKYKLDFSALFNPYLIDLFGFDVEGWVRFLGREILRTSAKALFPQFLFGKELKPGVCHAHL